jgi:tricorn protease-like protein
MMMSSALLCLDWSQSGEHIIVTNQSYEILIFNVSTGKIDHEKRPSGHVDTQWHTYTQKLGFPV